MAQSHLDVQALYVTLDSERQQRGLSWRQVAQEAGIGPSTLSRMAQGNRPDVDSFAALVGDEAGEEGCDYQDGRHYGQGPQVAFRGTAGGWGPLLVELAL